MAEEKFIVNAEINLPNVHVIAFPGSVPSILKTKNPAGVMIFDAVGRDNSIMPLHFIKAGLKINTKEYVSILEEVLFLWMDQEFRLNNMVLIQGSAPCHRSKKMRALLA